MNKNNQKEPKELSDLTKEDLQAFNDSPLEGCTLANPFDLTTDSGDDKIKTFEAITEFENKYHSHFKKILESVQNPDDRIALIQSFYDTMPDEVWNDLMVKSFRTNPNKCLDRFVKQKHRILSYDIKKEAGTTLSDVRYKTSVCERSKAWLIQEDTSFSGDKPEVLAQMKYNMYTVKAKIEEETIQIPFNDIIATLKMMDGLYNGIFEYMFISADLSDLKASNSSNPYRILRMKGNGPKKLEENNQIIFGVLRFRNDKVHGNNLVWNTIVKSRVKCEDIGFFTYGEYTKFIGNIWVDPRFRKYGIGKTIMDYITSKLLPKAGYIYINSKTPEMIKLIEAQDKFDHKHDDYKVRVHKIGKSLPYQFVSETMNPAKSHLKGLDSYIESMYVLSWYSNQDFIKDLKSRFETETLKSMLFCEDFFPSICIGNDKVQYVENDIPTAEELHLVTRSWYAGSENQTKTKIKIIGYTSDKNVVPGYYNYYTEQDEYFKHLVFEYKDETYLYPCHDGELHFGIPFQDIRTISTQISYDIDIHYTNDEVLFITHTSKISSNKTFDKITTVITLDNDFNSKYPDYDGEENATSNNFRMVQFIDFMHAYGTTGIENVFKRYSPETRYGKNLRAKFNIDDFTPVSFDSRTLQVKFESKDKTFTTEKNLKEIFDFLR